ncbi:hypothetical protein LNO89_05130 [Klebsiella pneumoniae subsp. pneumoniae]|nr:hypothetical protein [Klebsiella pneumoniae subsp. pneumoniae]
MKHGKKENLQPKPGADQLTVQSNLLPMDQLGKSGDSESAKKRTAGMAWH